MELPTKSCHFWQWIKALHILCDILMIATGVVALTATSLARTHTLHELYLLHHYENINVEIIFACSIVLIVIGAVNIYAVAKSSFPELLTITLLTGAFLVGTLVYTFYEGFTRDHGPRGRLHRQLNLEMTHYNRHVETVDTLQTTLSCCGLNGFEDWIKQNLPIPGSCCPGSGTCDENNNNLQSKGCFRSLVKMAGYYAWTTLVGLGFLYFVQVIAIILSYLLCRRFGVKKRQEALETADLKIPRVPNIARSESTDEATTSEQEPSAEEPQAEETELEPVPDVQKSEPPHMKDTDIQS